MQFMTLDKNLVATANSSSRLQVHALHVVKITQAYCGVTQNGAKFVSLNFVNAHGETADDIKVYYENNQGERLSGKAQLNAIMAFNDIQALSQTQGNYKTYDFEAGGLTDKQGLIVPELIGAYVGVVFAENWYTNQSGEAKYTLQLSAVFHYKTTQNGKQFIYNEPAIQGQIESAIDYAQKLSADSKQKATRQGQQSHEHARKPNPPQGMGHSKYQPMGNYHQQTPPVGGQVADEDMPFWLTQSP